MSGRGPLMLRSLARTARGRLSSLELGSPGARLLLRRGFAEAPRAAVRGSFGRAVGGSCFALGIALVATGGVYAADDMARSHAIEVENERRRAELEERQRKRQEEVQRLSSQASWWRLAELIFTMLPVVFYMPVWFYDPAMFWNYVAVRIDYCGPTFVKLAQWLSTRRDMFPDTVCEAFSGLQNQVSARWSEGLTSADVENGLRQNKVALKSLAPKAHASGSIAEVFFGVLEDGTDVAVKCLRPGVRALLEADLAWLLRFSQLADYFATLRTFGVRQATEEFCEHVQMQTDFSKEADHLRRFRANFDGSPEAVRFPAPLFVTDEALVLSRETGEELANIFRTENTNASLAVSEEARMAMRAEQIRKNLGMSEELGKQVARQSMAAYMRMIFNDQFIHGDLHPGNIMLHLKTPKPAQSAADVVDSAFASDHAGQRENDDEPRGFIGKLGKKLAAAFRDNDKPNHPRNKFELVILDAGLAIPLPRDKVEVLRSLAISIIYADFYRAADILYKVSPDNSKCWDPEAFKHGLAKAFEACRRNVWEEGFVQVSDACLEALHLVQRYNVTLDTTLTWTLFGMLSVEGSAKQLDPSVDCAQAATRYIITLPSLIRELRHQSPTTIKHMVCEMMFKTVGLDYWDWRYRNGRTWRDLQE